MLQFHSKHVPDKHFRENIILLVKKNHIVLPNWQPLWLFTYRNLAYSLKIKFEVLLCLQFPCIITIWHMTYSDDSLDQTDTLYVQYNLTFLV